MGTLSSKGKRIRGHKGVALRKQRMARTRWLCEHCLSAGHYVPAKIVNHIVPLCLGGLDTDSNTENLCGPCDDKATAAQFGRVLVPVTGLDGWPA